jgi:mRNA-degrading endonuclease RelE of RelBE toxin-antitoxin system
MGLPVIFTQQSLDDLGAIVARIASDDRDRAVTFGNELIDHALTLTRFSERGRIVPELNDPAVREIIHGTYRIMYEIMTDPNAIFVLRFWHAARGESRNIGDFESSRWQAMLWIHYKVT